MFPTQEDERVADGSRSLPAAGDCCQPAAAVVLVTNQCCNSRSSVARFLAQAVTNSAYVRKSVAVFGSEVPR